MKKVFAVIGIILTGSLAQAGQVHYLQDVQFDKDAKFGVNASSVGSRDASLILKNAASDATTTIKSTGSAAGGLTFILPTSSGTSGQALATDGTNGQLKFISVSTSSTNNTKDEIGFMIEGSTHNHITANYNETDRQLNLSVSTSVVLQGTNTSLGIVSVSSLASAGSITANSVAVTNGINAGGTVTAGSLASNGDVSITRTKKLILDSDQNSDTYIQQTVDDEVHFYKNATEYMRFE